MSTDIDTAGDWHAASEAHAPARPSDVMSAEQGRALRRAIPEVYRGFAALHDAALAPGALDTRTKELVALALSISKRCDGCVAAHARAAARHGATEEEVAEVIGVVVLMDGGPATSYGPGAWAAFREARSRTARPATRPR